MPAFMPGIHGFFAFVPFVPGLSAVMPGLVPGIHVLNQSFK
jgi:hypothetical protein